MSFTLKKKYWLPLLDLTGLHGVHSCRKHTFAWGERGLLQVREVERNALEPSGKGGFQNASPIAIFISADCKDEAKGFSGS